MTVDTGNGALQLYLNILKEVRVLFIGTAKLEFTKKTTRNEVSLRVAGSNSIRMASKGPDYES